MARSLSLCMLFTFVAACGSGNGNDQTLVPPGSAKTTPSAGEYRATVRWTSYGIPHIQAGDLGSLGFGQGYAFASLHACVLADQIVKVRGERARYFGPGEDGVYVDTDFGYRSLGLEERAKELLARASTDMREVLAGYAAGYNKYLADTGLDALPAACAGAEWVRPITMEELTMYALSVEINASSGFFIAAIGAAQPPSGSAGDKSAEAERPVRRSSLDRLDDRDRAARLGSNGWGIGAERSANGRGLLVANPHFPWAGELRFYESHLTVPGDIDVYGATLLGLPLVTIGFNKDLAWTHTFSDSRRFALYRLELAPDAPTRYKYGGEWRDMSTQELSVEVRQPDGSLRQETRTLYRSHHGPVLHDTRLPWTRANVFAIRDVARSVSLMEQYLAMNRARNLDQFQAAFKAHQGTPFLNTIYADRAGNAWYIDGSAVPDLGGAGMAAWQVAIRAIPQARQAWQDFRLIVFDGSMPMFELADDNPARPGSVPYERAPKLLRRDYVLNANDSYWLTHGEERLTGFSPFYGEAGKQPRARTRMNHRAILEVEKHTVETLQQQIMSGRVLTSELLRDPVVERCNAGRKDKQPCQVLAAWDGRYAVDSKGAVLWREVLAEIPEDALWREPFDIERPLATPSGLATALDKGPDPVLAAIDAAVARLGSVGLALDVPLGQAQYTMRGERRFPVPGNQPREGGLNPSRWAPAWLDSSTLPRMQRGEVIHAETSLGTDGYPVNYGSSFVMVVGFEDDGPRAQAVLTYSASSDPRSPHYTDQLVRYGSGDFWRPALFHAADIEADPNLRIQELGAPR